MNFAKCRNVVNLALFVFTKCRNFRLQQLHMSWRNENEMKLDNQSHEDRHKEIEGGMLYNVKKHEPYLDVEYEEGKTLTLFNQMKKKMFIFQ